MAPRLTRITTRTGDAGTTGLADGSRVAKDSARIEAIGAVDELNSALGVLLAETLPEPVRKCLDDVQHDLFDLGGELSVPGHAIVSAAQPASTISIGPNKAHSNGSTPERANSIASTAIKRMIVASPNWQGDGVNAFEPVSLEVMSRSIV